MNKNKNKLIKGGKIIASGGFGCIFNPALQCINDHEQRDNDYDQSDNDGIMDTKNISKLMSAKHAKDEYQQIQQFKSILHAIPNYQDYFLLSNITLCKPRPLTNEDLINYDKKCKALTKKNIKSKNVNQSLDQLLAINMPNGGINVESYIKTSFVSSNLLKLNNSLINLLVNGIVPMNALHVYHCDIKDANVLVQNTNGTFKSRLIDWGLSIILKGGRANGIPKKIYRRPFQFNVPFSSVLFNKDFLTKYNIFLNLHANPDYFQIREFVINYIFIWNEIRGPGHLDAINDIIRKLTIKDLTSIKQKNIKEHLIEYDFTYYYIVEYLSKILEKYTVNGNIDMISYINNVFFKNIDIWGFVMIYIAMFEHLYDNFNTLNEYQMQFILKIKYIIIHFLFESPTEPISVTELVKELTSLNSIIAKLEINHASTRLAYLKANRVSLDTISYQNIRRTKHTKRNKNNKNNRNYRNKTVKNKK